MYIENVVLLVFQIKKVNNMRQIQSQKWQNSLRLSSPSGSTANKQNNGYKISKGKLMI